MVPYSESMCSILNSPTAATMCVWGGGKRGVQTPWESPGWTAEKERAVGSTYRDVNFIRMALADQTVRSSEMAGKVVV